ncbi:DUF4019 domain-containing protein [Qipengyuania sp. XHP0211]|uniref:helix-turn-helix domain-containing protein n=1 Tax=Qipengyuania sp. XHP0211 TaxID=3038079 RepID=UPI00241F3CED|nr:DUF4019 domain-containing protein [Qipengyuania sp. XHP0211]MDG5751654.1 DUF4019 domain-containing protein [Qipengyuania sp. XHP0211]
MEGGVASLTDRERDVLRLLLAGHTAKSAAAELDLSVHTVNDYLREARKKLGVASSREAARILGEQEAESPQSAPQNAAAEQIGMADTTPATHTPKPSATRDRRNRVAWIIGGTLMFTAIIAAVLLATSSGSHDAGEEEMEASLQQGTQAEATARDWIKLVDAGNYQESWAQAGPMFKSAVTADAWAKQVTPVRQPLGEVVSRNLKGIDAPASLPGAPKGEYRIITFDTDYSAALGAVETVVLAKSGDSWGVVGYFIR